jgi:choline dehydrogenase-like flavoprotein
MIVNRAPVCPDCNGAMRWHSARDLQVGRRRRVLNIFQLRQLWQIFVGRVRASRAACASVAPPVPLELIGFVKTRKGLDAPNIEFMMTGARMQDARPWVPFVQTPSQDLMGSRTVLLHPKSKGKVSLRSADPSTPVRIAFNFLLERSDLIALRDACRLGFGVAIRKPLDPFRGRTGRTEDRYR